MPLHLEVYPPEYLHLGEKRGDLGRLKYYISARGHMALCAESNQFIVPLEPPPQYRNPARTPGHQDTKNYGLNIATQKT